MSTEPSWIAVGVKLHPDGKPGYIFKVVKIDTTGNGSRMVYMELVDEPDVKHAEWEAYILNGRLGTFSTRGKWFKVPELTPPPGPTLNRFELLDFLDD